MPTLPRTEDGVGEVAGRGTGRRGGTTASPPRTVGAGRVAGVEGRVAGLPAELGRGDEPLDQPREGEPIGRAVVVGRDVVPGRVVVPGRAVLPGRTVDGRAPVGRLVEPGRTVVVGRRVPVGREVDGRLVGRDVDGRLVGRDVGRDVGRGREVGRDVGRDCGRLWGLEAGREGRLAGRDGRLAGRLGRLWGRDAGRLVWPRVRWAAAGSGEVGADRLVEAAASALAAGPASMARTVSPAARGERRSRRARRELVRSVMAIGDGDSMPIHHQMVCRARARPH